MISVLLLALAGCGDDGTTLEARGEEPEPEEIAVVEPIAYTSDPYAQNLRGTPTIEELRGIIDANAFVWHGFAEADKYPGSGDCDFSRNGDQATVTTDKLPAVIEGVVTLHPRYFVKTAICGESERFSGSFFLPDATGGMLILRDSRISPFSYGDRVRLRVKGLMKYFDYDAVLAFDELEVVTGDAPEPISFEEVEGAFRDDDKGLVRRIRGTIVSEATNNNFNEMIVEGYGDRPARWLVSLDRELGQRKPALGPGTEVEFTGPIINSFGLRMLVASYGQIRFKDQWNEQ